MKRLEHRGFPGRTRRSAEVYVDGALMDETLYDTAQKTPSRLPELTDPHGSYAFHPQEPPDAS